MKYPGNEKYWSRPRLWPSDADHTEIDPPATQKESPRLADKKKV